MSFLRWLSQIERTFLIAGSLLTCGSTISWAHSLSLERSSIPAISSPRGSLRPGMTKREATRLLQRPVEELRDNSGTIYSRRIDRNFKNETYFAFLTTRGTVYSVLFYKWTRNPSERRSLERLFAKTASLYGATVISDRETPEVMIARTVFRQRYSVEVILGCNRTELTVRISDYLLQPRDDRSATHLARMPVGSCFF